MTDDNPRYNRPESPAMILRAGLRQARLNAEWSGRTALHEAVMYRNHEAVAALLDFAIDSLPVDKIPIGGGDGSDEFLLDASEPIAA